MLTNFKSGNSTDLTEVRHILILSERDYFVASIVSNDERFIEIIRDKDVEVVKKYTKQITTKINRIKKKEEEPEPEPDLIFKLTSIYTKDDEYYVQADLKEINKVILNYCVDSKACSYGHLCTECKFNTNMVNYSSNFNVYTLDEFKREYIKSNNENTD